MTDFFFILYIFKKSTTNYHKIDTLNNQKTKTNKLKNPLEKFHIHFVVKPNNLWTK